MKDARREREKEREREREKETPANGNNRDYDFAGSWQDPSRNFVIIVNNWKLAPTSSKKLAITVGSSISGLRQRCPPQGTKEMFASEKKIPSRLHSNEPQQ